MFRMCFYYTCQAITLLWEDTTAQLLLLSGSRLHDGVWTDLTGFSWYAACQTFQRQYWSISNIKHPVADFWLHLSWFFQCFEGEGTATSATSTTATYPGNSTALPVFPRNRLMNRLMSFASWQSAIMCHHVPSKNVLAPWRPLGDLWKLSEFPTSWGMHSWARAALGQDKKVISAEHFLLRDMNLFLFQVSSKTLCWKSWQG